MHGENSKGERIHSTDDNLGTKMLSLLRQERLR